MKKNSFLWAALSMTAALVMTACSNDDNANESPVQQSTVKTIPYSVTVNEGAITRATVDSDNKTLKFADGDKLYVTGTNIKGVLNIQTGMGETTGATFSGDLTYSGSGSPASDLPLTATLVSAQQTDGSEVTINATTGAVTVNYPSTAYCSSVNDAVQKYSNLTGTSTYGARAFTLTQQTAFLNFVITFEDGTATGTALSAVVNNNSSDICSASVTTETVSENVVAKFVLPVAAGTTLSSATVTMGSKAALNINNATLTGKVYNVRKTQAAPAYTMAAAATTSDKGKLICTAGHIHVYGEDAACTAGRVAKIIYVGSTGHATYNNGLALALEDMSPNPYTAFTWDNSGANNDSKTAAELCSAWNTSKPVMDAEWLLASKDQWNYMLGTNGAGSYYALRVGFTSVGGSNLVEMDYWSSTEYEYDTTKAWSVNLGYESWYENSKGRDYPMVRACLAF